MWRHYTSTCARGFAQSSSSSTAPATSLTRRLASARAFRFSAPVSQVQARGVLTGRGVSELNSAMRSTARVFAGGVKLQTRGVFVISENTPNPESKMFYPQGKDVLGNNAKTKTFADKFVAKDSLLASSLFRVQGVNSVLLAPRHVTVTKDVDADWAFLKANVELVMSQFFAAGLDPVDPKSVEFTDDGKPKEKKENVGGEEGMIAEILDLLEERVKPFVQQDGGDVEFDRIEDNVVYLKMQGACSGCPKSGITLNIQIKQLIQHYFPDVVDVREAIDPDDEHIPRPGDNPKIPNF